MVSRPPRRGHTGLRGVVDRVSPRGWGVLVIGGFGSCIRSWAYCDMHPTPASLAWVERAAPLGAYSVVWAMCGILCLVTVTLGQRPSAQNLVRALLPWAVGSTAFLNGLWAVSLLTSQVHDGGRTYLSGLSYALIAFAMFLIGSMIDPPDLNLPEPPDITGRP
jgi:hypothetical protein